MNLSEAATPIACTPDAATQFRPLPPAVSTATPAPIGHTTLVAVANDPAATNQLQADSTLIEQACQVALLEIFATTAATPCAVDLAARHGVHLDPWCNACSVCCSQQRASSGAPAVRRA